MSDQLIPVLNKDAVVQLNIGAGFVKQLASVLYFLAENKSSEELESFTKKVKNNEELEPWEFSYLVIQQLVQEVYARAKEQGKTSDVPLSNIIPQDDQQTPQKE